MATDSNIVSQLFSAYDEKIDDANFIEGNERFDPNLFKRTYTVFKLAHLTSRIVDLSNPKLFIIILSISLCSYKLICIFISFCFTKTV